AFLDQPFREGKALLGGPSAANVAMDDGRRFRLARAATEEVAVAQLAEADVHHAGRRFHDVGVEIAQAACERSLRFGRKAGGQVELEVWHGVDYGWGLRGEQPRGLAVYRVASYHQANSLSLLCP